MPKIKMIIFVYIFMSIDGGMDANADFLVAIDIGHTLSNPGSTSSRGRTEYSFNKEIAIVVDDEINKNQHLSSFIVNPEGINISLRDRTKIAQMQKADLFLSLHHDSVQPRYLHKWIYKKKHVQYSDKFEGYSIFVSGKNIRIKESQSIAINIGQQLLKIGLKPTLHHSEPISGENRKMLDKENGVYEYNDLIVLKTASMPAVLLECGIIVNRKEELLVSSKKFKREVAQAIVKAIVQFVESQKVVDNF